MIDTTELRRLADAATPGPWHDKMHCTVNSGAPHFEVVADTEMDHGRMTENAAYIAAAHPAAVLALLDEVERLRSQLAHWKTFAIHAEGERAAWKKTAQEIDAELIALRAATAEGRTYTQADLLEAVRTERHACSICVWMVLQDALAPDADDKGLEGWMREAEERVKRRLEGRP